MPKIMKDQEQLDALKTIEKDLDQLRCIDILSSASPDVTFALCVAPEGKAAKGEYVAFDKKQNSRLKTVLSAQRTAYESEIETLCNKHRISLSDEESALVAKKEPNQKKAVRSD